MDGFLEYQVQDIFNPKYLFHGTAHEVEKLECRQSSDSDNKDNKDNAIFLTSSFYTAVAYAFSRRLKEINEHYSFTMNNNGELPVMTFEVDNLPDDLCGYIYVFDKSDDMIKDNHQFTTQYRCYHDLIPQRVIKVDYKDFEEYFSREKTKRIVR
ncbi:MAG: hypothetical protein IJL76_01625 [Bacilli bacterium]|nr:hypothetical protein [Bacilli bacterium]